MLRLVFLFFSALFIFPDSTAQTPDYPKNYFRHPLGIPMEIVANLGELRTNHWHMGLDIRTNQKENQPVYAAADGYIAHIGIRPQSFGRFIIINHPNGLSTLYGHLNDFFPDLEKYVTEQQYKQETWAIELSFSPDQFPVYKSKFIALSGNTGGSQGPHVHFEIFHTESGKRLNTLMFGFPLPDNVPPNLVKLAMYDRSLSTYEQNPILFNLKNTDSGYIIPKQPLIKTGSGRISFSLQAYDRMSRSNNQDGIYSAQLYVDEEWLGGFVLDSIDYAASAYMNAHVDYRYRHFGGAWLQHLSALPGEKSGVYKFKQGDGVLHLADTVIRNIRIEVKDARMNTSELRFRLQYSDSLAAAMNKAPAAVMFAPNRPNIFKREEFEILMPERSLYDSAKPFYNRIASSSVNTFSDMHQFHDPSVPVHGEMIVKIKANKAVPEEWKDKLIIQRSYRSSTSVRVAELQDDWLTTSFGDFGIFQAFADLTPPSVNDIGRGDTVDLSPASRILFTPTDNFGVKSFRAELNGQWLRFTNDKSRNWIYVFDERCPYGVHHLKVTVEDMVGNTTTKEWWFKRNPYTPPKKKVPMKKKTPVKKTTVKKPAAKKN